GARLGGRGGRGGRDGHRIVERNAVKARGALFMARMRVFMVFVLAITAGGALALGTYNYMQKAPATRTVSIPTKPVVVAAADLDLGTGLRREDIRIIHPPATPAPPPAPP